MSIEQKINYQLNKYPSMKKHIWQKDRQTKENYIKKLSTVWGVMT